MKPSLPKGTRDFSPQETARRKYIFDTIREAFELYGFQSIETPAMENLSTLTGKYGDEGDRLIFKILNSGDFLKDVREKELSSENPNDWIPLISEKALRYDLTVPFARFVAMNRNTIPFPFKRYQIQPVWRADRPQKGRYREFWQCDADVVGSGSLINEAELIQIYDEVFSNFRLPVKILINNRKILAGIAETIGKPDQLIDITVAIDKLDKIGMEKVLEELATKGFDDSSLELLKPIFNLQGGNTEKLHFLSNYLQNSDTGKQGILELNKVLSYFEGNQKLLLRDSVLEIDITLARGLNYYTGTILEVKAKELEYGSIGGGGRYDDLTGIFGLPGVPGVGISFGADRIYDVLSIQELFPESSFTGTEILIANFSEQDEKYALALLQILRKSGIRSEIYPEFDKLKKQFDYAEKKNIPFLMIYGEGERAKNTAEIKELFSGKQLSVPISEISSFKSFFSEA
ncbi:MAG: histidine--tRNA ligase [Bacteroidia bacterium]